MGLIGKDGGIADDDPRCGVWLGSLGIDYSFPRVREFNHLMPIPLIARIRFDM
jgi:hypothetical protein